MDCILLLRFCFSLLNFRNIILFYFLVDGARYAAIRLFPQLIDPDLVEHAMNYLKNY